MQLQYKPPKYLAPGAKDFVPYPISELPPIPTGCTRVVCISDTHNEHDSLPLPWGHVLVHTGDILTESGERHILNKDTGHPKAKPFGLTLVDKFVKWFAATPHPHKAFIGGNHDWVLQAMGAVEVRKVVDKYAQPGKLAYLEHQEAVLGPLKLFGSPNAHWGGHNDAFMCYQPDWSQITSKTHIVLTHMPPLLPADTPGVVQETSHGLVPAIKRSGALLSVSGHCHWAHGIFFSPNGGPPYVVASICGADWKGSESLKVGPTGARGDPEDRQNGGYNLYYPVLVCDLAIPGGPPSEDDRWNIAGLASSLPLSKSREITKKPALLFFGPPTDPDAVARLTPLFEKKFDVYHFDDANEAKAVIKKGTVTFACCVAKLGSTKNLGKTVVKALRKKNPNALIIIHSSTAMNNQGTQQYLIDAAKVNLFVDESTEDVMFNKINQQFL